MESFDQTMLQPPVPQTASAGADTTATNPSSLTLALIGVGTWVLLGIGRRTLSRRTALRAPTQSTVQQVTERRAA